MQQAYFKDFTQKRIEVEAGVTIQVIIGGSGKPLLMLHGHPETHLMWHKVARQLAQHYTLVIPDLRGYGESSHPRGLPDHSTYAKRTMGIDQDVVMTALGYESYYLMGHDRGARVAHRMVKDLPQRVEKCIILDIVPTYDMYMQTDFKFAKNYYHWFFLIQENGLPERLLANSREEYVRSFLMEYEDAAASDRIFTKPVRDEYVKYLATEEGVHSICEDYRASATIDLAHDELDRDRTVSTPILVMWGEDGALHKHFDVLAEWKKRHSNITGICVPHCGHFIPEQSPDDLVQAVTGFLGT
ncbi:MAG: alpha/beta hydrolase [Clostridiales bacterium]|nr:alpha/beta hydrolase [Clostridiales bacterium]